MQGITRKLSWILGGVVLCAAVGAVGLPVALRGIVKRKVVGLLRDRFASEVEITDFQVSVWPRIDAVARGIVLRHKGRTDVPPLMTIESLTIIAPISGLLRKPNRVAAVRLAGLQIHVPPRQRDESRVPSRSAGARRVAAPLFIEELTSDDALLEILPREAGKLPREFKTHRVLLRSVGLDRPAWFHATLTNPKPVGEIDSEGTFGPWDADEPSRTPVAATFRFSNADLSTVGGIAGILSSRGKYSGVLDRLDVEGDTDTPDFALRVSGNPLPLQTHYVAVVDGTNGNTYLRSVVARFLHSTIVASGEVVGTPGVKGRHIALEAVARNARVEDLMQLAVRGHRPPMTGQASLHAKIDLSPGDGDIIDRLFLDGQFGIAGAHFTNAEVQGKLDSLSRRGQGEPKNENIENVISNLRGHFVFRNGRATFANLAFDVPGAKVELKGSYNLQTEALDFHGNLLLQAKLSQTTTGAKSFFLKLFDPFFKGEGGGTLLPIKITGNRSSPVFALDRGRGHEPAQPHPAAGTAAPAHPR